MYITVTHTYILHCTIQQLFRAEELQSLVVGNELHDFREMENVRIITSSLCRYMSFVTTLTSSMFFT